MRPPPPAYYPGRITVGAFVCVQAPGAAHGGVATPAAGKHIIGITFVLADVGLHRSRNRSTRWFSVSLEQKPYYLLVYGCILAETLITLILAGLWFHVP